MTCFSLSLTTAKFSDIGLVVKTNCNSQGISQSDHRRKCRIGFFSSKHPLHGSKTESGSRRQGCATKAQFQSTTIELLGRDLDNGLFLAHDYVVFDISDNYKYALNVVLSTISKFAQSPTADEGDDFDFVAGLEDGVVFIAADQSAV